MQKFVLFTGEDEPKALAALGVWLADDLGGRQIGHSSRDVQLAIATNKDVGMHVSPKALAMRQDTIGRLYGDVEVEVVEVA